MDPSEVMARVDRVWHVLETRASWSLLHSLSSRYSSLHMDQQSSQVSVTTHQAPIAVTVPITSSESPHNSSEVPLAPLNPGAPVFHPSPPEDLQTSVSGGTPATNTMKFPHSGESLSVNTSSELMVTSSLTPVVSTVIPTASCSPMEGTHLPTGRNVLPTYSAPNSPADVSLVTTDSTDSISLAGLSFLEQDGTVPHPAPPDTEGTIVP